MQTRLPAVLLAASLACACGQQPAQSQPRFGDGEPTSVGANALREVVEDDRTRAFYEQRGWRPAWTNRAEADLRSALEAAGAHGLNPAPYLRMMDGPGSDAERERRLTAAAFAYADVLATGAVDPTELNEIFTLERNKPDLVKGLEAALADGRVRDWLNSLAPADAEYARLSEAYVQAEREAANERLVEIPGGDLIRPGDRDPRTPQIRSALARHGLSINTAEPREPMLYSNELADAVARFQERQGMKVDGVVGPATIRALNRGAAHRARKLAINMERRRWLARDVSPTRIDVNIAAARMTYYRDGTEAWNGRVIAGEPNNKTPPLQSAFARMVVNPPWRVPRSIASEEILPKGEAYLRQNNMYVADDGMVVQRPGPEAALGLVKFDMVNPYAIYLHDTPAKALFAEDERHRSHGCVRVEDAVAFARLLASHHGGEDFDQALASGDTRPVSLDREIPVRLLYHTAHLGEAGEVVFVQDVYGRDARLAKAMGLDWTEEATDRPTAVLLGP